MMFFWPRPKRIKQLEKEIAERKQAVEKLQIYQQQIRQLVNELVLADERERRRIAVFLCDDLAQNFASLKMSLDALDQSALSAEQASTLEEALRRVEKMIQDVRSLALDLSPAILYEIGLEPALEWLTEKIQADHGIAASFEDDSQDKPLAESIRLGLFRVVRELLANAAKHSRAQHVKVSTRKDGSNIQIQVEDDGVGFDLAAAQARRDAKFGFGLLLVKELLRHLGGSLQIDSKPGRGTRVALVAPLRD